MRWNHNEMPDTDVSSPDLTNEIMSRLGYVRISAEQARRARRKRWAARSATAAMLVVTAAFGVHLHSLSERARTPGADSLPSAISNDLTNARDGLREAGRVMFPEPTRSDESTTPATDDLPHQSRVPWSGLL